MTQTKDIKPGDLVVMSEAAKKEIKNDSTFWIEILSKFKFPAKVKKVNPAGFQNSSLTVASFEEEYLTDKQAYNFLHFDWIDKHEPEEKQEPDWRGLPLLW